ncbi:MAG: hypothetical protein COV10_01270 [Candidatus Vogelbacteria bacterium CG10_big_fil_rev_8_21_14_0_10_51_16]|uniref:DUF7282 domain-containing protein n=1 Tax=Candidatus Vogelbacteria bacterium CG10_big_fil_rev_8_21_14_0_10_51_16 TaxID=1975045 RepID=A0A2H0RFI3_9BACT|nr:MAG: hypothetical protein COV10_01270 [Candidatus Vogelbacteria bacterium CG10_big_fil_rev_8_21_14_0_10_51_16]
MNGMSETNKVVLAAVLGIIIGFGFGRFTTERNATELEEAEEVGEEMGAPSPNESTAETNDIISATDSDMVVQDSNGAVVTTVSQETSVTSAVTALDQSAGMSVKTLVSMDRRGWVVVHEQTNGVPARILGAKPYGPATGEVRVNLLRGTKAGSVYYVMLHSDDGDIEDFSLSRDLPLLGANGMPIMVMFKAL